ncbi:Fur family transcriptional regulator [Empedobacter brevis]|uniref:Fur family transcriptional regulator n=1 Tax=Empedobacter brevis TaxID=247 RepID=UPI002FE308D6
MRNTIPKIKILNLIEDSNVALSHSEIQQSLENICDRVTIYRVLKRLLVEGFIHKISDIDGTVKYARCHGCMKKEHFHNHIHFSCEICNRVTCLEHIEPKFNLPPGYKIKNVNYIISGICTECSS